LFFNSKKIAARHQEEEVFAENYDDHEETSLRRTSLTKPSSMVTTAEAMEKIKFMVSLECLPKIWDKLFSVTQFRMLLVHFCKKIQF
jgi:hypothetical protein